MYVKEKPVTLMLLWSQTWQLLASQKKPLLQISLLVVFLPALLLSFYFAAVSGPLADDLRELANLGLRGEGVRANYEEVLALVSPFFTRYALVGGAYLVAVLTAVFAMLRLTVTAAYDEQAIGVGEALREGLRTTLPRGLGLLLLLLFLSTEQLFFGPFRVFTLFALMTPVLMVTERRGVWSALKQALLLRYASPSRGGGMTCALMLLTLSVMLYAFESVTQEVLGFVLHADEWLGLPRSLWVMRLPGFPFSPIYAVTHIVSVALAVATLVFVIGFLVSLFFSVRAQVSHRI